VRQRSFQTPQKRGGKAERLDLARPSSAAGGPPSAPCLYWRPLRAEREPTHLATVSARRMTPVDRAVR
jgi:hypothetical protein